MTDGTAAASNQPSLFRRPALNTRNLKWKSLWENISTPFCGNPSARPPSTLLNCRKIAISLIVQFCPKTQSPLRLQVDESAQSWMPDFPCPKSHVLGLTLENEPTALCRNIPD